MTTHWSAAGSIVSKMDQSVSPCEDFYSFSCGGWLKENPIPEDSSSYGIYPWLRQHVDIRLKGLITNNTRLGSSKLTVGVKVHEYNV